MLLLNLGLQYSDFVFFLVLPAYYLYRHYIYQCSYSDKKRLSKHYIHVACLGWIQKRGKRCSSKEEPCHDRNAPERREHIVATLRRLSLTTPFPRPRRCCVTSFLESTPHSSDKLLLRRSTHTRTRRDLHNYVTANNGRTHALLINLVSPT